MLKIAFRLWFVLKPLFCKGWGPKHCDHPDMMERGHSKEEEKKSTGNLQKTSPDKLIVIKDKRESNMSGRIQNDTVTPVQ